jgi:hypothetical protein
MLTDVFDVSRPIEWIKNNAIAFIKWIALKTLLLGLFTTVLPLSIYTAWKLINEQIMEFVMQNATSQGSQAAIVQLTGLAAWLGDKLRFQECFVILSSALMYRFILSFFRK